ncbi:MAG: hypothetical protein PHX87_05650 [Candidatus Peribacteraceae bacterium]|nr:hypothetical protein [Candidatus Peribacteraceae bacterium]MDD5742877.1 hypothetical protein [Candidatus Peribacteraceae bacterium]
MRKISSFWLGFMVIVLLAVIAVAFFRHTGGRNGLPDGNAPAGTEQRGQRPSGMPTQGQQPQPVDGQAPTGEAPVAPQGEGAPPSDGTQPTGW